MVGVKNGYMDRLGDLNIRIGDIRRELKGWTDTTDDGAPVFVPTIELVEIENAPVTVKDSEIKSQRWLSAPTRRGPRKMPRMPPRRRGSRLAAPTTRPNARSRT